MIERRITQIALIGIACSVAVSVVGGEKVQFKGSTSIELPQPKRYLDESQGRQPGDGPSGRAEYQQGMATSVPTQGATPQIDKKMKEMLDKKKNWIFMNPYEDQFDSKTSEFLEGEKGTGLFDHPLMQKEEKTVLERFLDEKNPNRERDPESDSRERSSDRELKSEQMSNKSPGESVTDERNLSKTGEKALSFGIENKTPVAGEGSLFQKKLERSLFTEDRFSSAKAENSISKEDIRKERDNRDAEITKMLQPRTSIAGSTPGRFDPINSAVDATRQDASPIGARRIDGFLSQGRPEAGGGSAGRNSPIFSGGGSSAPSGLADRNPSFDFGARASASAPRFSGSGPATIAPPRSTASQTPFVLPRPQRKF